MQKCVVHVLKESSEIANRNYVLNDRGLIAACARVTWKDNEQSSQPRDVTLIFNSPGEQRRAAAIPEWWHSARVEDVAITCLDGSFPQGGEITLSGSSAAFSTPVEALRSICPSLQLLDVYPFCFLKLFTREEAAFFWGTAERD